MEEDYNQVLDALQVSVEAATTAFARAVKFEVIQQFRELGVRIVMEIPTSAEPLVPCWVQQLSVTFPVSKSASRHTCKSLLKDLGSGVVVGIARTLSNYPTRTSKLGCRVHLIGATSTDIKEVREGLFSFFVKQKWAVSRHERP